MSKNRFLVALAILAVFWVFFFVLFGIELDSKETIGLFLPLIWGNLFYLGGAYVLQSKWIVRLEKDTLIKDNKFKKAMTERCQQVSDVIMAMVCLTLSFVAMSVFFLLRSQLLDWLVGAPFSSEKLVIWVVRLYESLLLGLIIFPSVGSVIIGGWCLYFLTRSRLKHIVY